MIERQGVAVVTICRDDAFFLKRWVEYYGGLFGRSSLYIISHGDTEMVRTVGAGCNIVPVPAIKTDKFTMLHWRTKNALKDALRQWYAHVIVCDVDEFIVVDPETGLNLRTWLEAAATNTVYTAFGLEIVHLRTLEPDPVETHILGPRRHAQVAMHYAKPCIVSRACRIARGGHYAEHDKLNLPPFLYLFHMRYCDFDFYVETMERRNTFVEAQQSVSDDGTLRTNPKWFRENRKDIETFEAFERREVASEFDLGHVRRAMHASWEPRGHGMWHFHRREFDELYRVPDRFAGADLIAPA